MQGIPLAHDHRLSKGRKTGHIVMNSINQEGGDDNFLLCKNEGRLFRRLIHAFFNNKTEKKNTCPMKIFVKDCIELCKLSLSVLDFLLTGIEDFLVIIMNSCTYAILKFGKRKSKKII
jgi:hypothetical protein